MAGYGTDDGFAAWLTANGYTAAASGLSAAILRQRGSAYVDGLYSDRFPGVPTNGIEQDRAWPRTGASAYGTDIGASTVPTAVIHASYLAAVQEDASPGSLAVVVTASQQVKREKVGPIEVEYHAGGDSAVASATPILSAIEGLLAPLLGSNVPAIYAA
jgi:hypothetical protein